MYYQYIFIGNFSEYIIEYAYHSEFIGCFENFNEGKICRKGVGTIVIYWYRNIYSILFNSCD